MPDTRDQMTVIGADTYIKGEMVFDQSATVLGRFEGRIVSKGDLIIGPTAQCKATLDAPRIIVDGQVEGDVVARERLELNAGATVQGDIVAAKLVVAEGAVFVGHCRVGDVPAAKTPAPGNAPATGTPAPDGRAAPATIRPPMPRVVTTPSTADIEATLAGFESKLAEFSRAKPGAAGNGHE